MVKRHVFDEIDFTFGLHFDSTLFSQQNCCELSSNDEKKNQIQSVEIVQSVVKNLSFKIKESYFFWKFHKFTIYSLDLLKSISNHSNRAGLFLSFPQFKPIQSNPIHSMVFLLQTVSFTLDQMVVLFNFGAIILD